MSAQAADSLHPRDSVFTANTALPRTGSAFAAAIDNPGRAGEPMAVARGTAKDIARPLGILVSDLEPEWAAAIDAATD